MEKIIQFHKTLNQDLWDGETLKKEVKKTLDRVSKEFIKFLKIDETPSDILLIGSLANYNYTEFSDMDIHVVVDFAAIGKDKKFIKEYFDAKKFVWNHEHDIKIFGYEIECYVQDKDEKNSSTAVYSIKNSEWLKKPSNENPKIDMVAVRYKAKDFSEQIDMAKGDLESLTSLKEKIKKMRQAGLDKVGEYSVENLTFKALRHSGKIKKLLDYAKNIFDKDLSLAESQDWENLLI